VRRARLSAEHRRDARLARLPSGPAALARGETQRSALNDAQQRQAAIGWPVATVHSIVEALVLIGLKNATL
jgi:hypothetical protein